MADLNPRGSPTAPVWVIAERPYPQDKEKGFIFSGGYGYTFHKMMQDAGITDYYVCARRPDPETPSAISIVENHLNHYKPPLIIVLEEAGKVLLPQLRAKGEDEDEDTDESEISKYCGSLLRSDNLSYPHYILPTYAPDYIVANWAERDIVTSIDLGKVKSELDFYKKHGYLQPLPMRELKYELSFEELIYILENRFLGNSTSLLSTDIETVYTNTKSAFYPHPGYPVTIGIADSPTYGISFNLFWDSRSYTCKLWKTLSKIFWEIPQLGQNFFNFDTCFIEALGFRICHENIKDTLIRHHILWPELSHKLQFMTRQYTREPYYKDEGKRWSLKDMKGLRRYNCLDVCVTYEVYLEQEKEFAERPYLI